MSIPKAAGIETELAIVGDEHHQASVVVIEAYTRLKQEQQSEQSKTSAAGPAYVGTDPNLGLWLANGARFYVDHMHPEYSTPESVDPVTVAMQDRAGAEIAAWCVRVVNAERSAQSPLALYKNVSDHLGHSFSCHCNFLLDAETFVDLFNDKAHWIFAYLIPFQASQIILSGAGKVGAENNMPAVRYQISQRADFMLRAVSLQTTYMRGIVNTRDEAHADLTRFRRLHVISFDSNMCPYACWLKIGTMQLVLRMLEDHMLVGSNHKKNNLYLANPVAAFHQISRDLTCKKPVQLEDGRMYSALDLQTIFFEYAQQYEARIGLTACEKEVLQAWGETLHLLRQHDNVEPPMELFGKLDWVTKYYALQNLAVQHNWEFDSPQAIIADMAYHALEMSNTGLFLLLEKQGLIVAPPRWKLEAIQSSLFEPPLDSRAYMRGKCIARFTNQITRVDWEEIIGHDGRLELPNPLEMRQTTTQNLLNTAETFQALIQARPWQEVVPDQLESVGKLPVTNGKETGETAESKKGRFIIRSTTRKYFKRLTEWLLRKQRKPQEENHEQRYGAVNSQATTGIATDTESTNGTSDTAGARNTAAIGDTHLPEA